VRGKTAGEGAGTGTETGAATGRTAPMNHPAGIVNLTTTPAVIVTGAETEIVVAAAGIEAMTRGAVANWTTDMPRTLPTGAEGGTMMMIKTTIGEFSCICHVYFCSYFVSFLIHNSSSADQGGKNKKNSSVAIGSVYFRVWTVDTIPELRVL